ncbi:MAG TPA: hypothetical protein VNT52_16685 [Acidimicrobiales bacterium]|nr:hypothetical protein [Acidimicrobiales bacterium]
MASSELPRFKPMLASPGPAPADTSAWAAEPKIDGFRSLVFLPGDGGMRVESRSGRNLTGAVPELAALAAAVGTDAVLDGELVVLGEDARPDFYALGPRLNCTRPASIERGRRRAPVAFIAFDLLWLAGERLTHQPYRCRREILESLSLAGPAWATIPSWPGAAQEAFDACEAMGMEGIVLKAGPYTERRSANWRKLKTAAWKRDHAPRRRPGIRPG